MDITDEDVTKTLEGMRERAANVCAGRGAGDSRTAIFAQVKLLGTPEGGGDPLQAESVLCHIGAEETMEPFNAKLERRERKAIIRILTWTIRPTIPIQSWRERSINYAVEVLASRPEAAGIE